MTVLVQGPRSVLLGAKAMLVEDDRDVASSWAHEHMTFNEAIKWVIAKYVEADRANYNNQYWRLEDLQMKKPTVVHSPMNMNHEAHHIVGTWTAAELIYPTREHSDHDQTTNPYIEVVGAFWRFYFPGELARIEDAFRSGSLHVSMECVSETVTCIGEGGCGRSFAYSGPRSASYCEHLLNGGVKQLDNPHFLGGALIVPPSKPGWGGAAVKELSRLMTVYAETAESIYDAVAEESPHLNANQWEWLMCELLLQAESRSSIN